MRDPDEFDAFYAAARERLLLQTYALTGDLAASRGAVRQAFVVAWHHWRKVSKLDDPETWVRPFAWSHAQRRQTARLWHRDKALDPEVRATLDALGKLPVTQRKALLLTQLATVSMDQMAREIGIPLDQAERELQVGAAQFSVAREIPTPAIRTLFEPLAATASASRWPRAPILRRAGGRRRRAHTAVGAAVAIASVVLTGSLVTDAAGVRPTLSREHHDVDRENQLEVAAATLPDSAMLGAEQVGAVLTGGTWRVASTDDNSEGSGLVLPCRQDRYADPAGTAALIRTFDSTPKKPKSPTVTLAQSTEASVNLAAARRTFLTSVGWYAGCVDGRVQLVSTRRVSGVGDAAMLLALRTWDAPASTLVVGLARTGQFTTTTITRIGAVTSLPLKRATGVLAAAVDGLCTLPDAGACAALPSSEQVRPMPVGDVPGMLSEVDLPPVSGVSRPWVGTEPQEAKENVAATRCDDADFEAKGISDALTRSFLIPEAELPDEFGLTETVGSMPVKLARAFVADVRDGLARCPDRDLGTEVTRVAHVAEDDTDLSVWHLTTEITDKMAVSYQMAIVRSGTAVAQLQFVGSDKVEMTNEAFIELAQRALDRLPKLPPPD